MSAPEFCSAWHVVAARAVRFVVERVADPGEITAMRTEWRPDAPRRRPSGRDLEVYLAARDAALAELAARFERPVELAH